MKQAQQLRDKADRCYRLARLINTPQDFARLEAIGAEANQAAADLEAADADIEARIP